MLLQTLTDNFKKREQSALPFLGMDGGTPIPISVIPSSTFATRAQPVSSRSITNLHKSPTPSPALRAPCNIQKGGIDASKGWFAQTH